ncbi:MAG: vitamin K epoxide reductase family protein [bacterium]|nr:vitamin K epoxide reductase family protein [bacterium]
MKIPLFSDKILLYFILLFMGVGGFFFTVFMQKPQGFYAFVMVAALGGLGVATNIYITKKNKGHLVCPTGSNCNAVVTSRYSKFFGISLEYLGMFYFFLVLLGYSFLLFAPYLLSQIMLTAIMLLTMGAFFFSCYLLFVQAVLLRQWCIWCILASTFSMTIFIMSLISLEPAITLLTNIAPLIAMTQMLGFILGMGGSTATAFLFFAFLEDRKLSDNEINAWKGVSEIIWAGLALTMMSQFAFYILDPITLGQSGPFLLQMISLFVVAVTGAGLMILCAPFLAIVPFKKEIGKPSPTEQFRRPTFIAGSLALSSWYVAFAMNHIAEYSFGTLFSLYLLILLLAVCTGILWERRILASSK